MKTIDEGAIAVIFTSRRSGNDEGYGETIERMLELSRQADGFLGFESVRQDDRGIAVSYWRDEAAVAAWKAEAEHLIAQEKGRRDWYREYDVRICRVIRQYGFSKPRA